MYFVNDKDKAGGETWLYKRHIQKRATHALAARTRVSSAVYSFVYKFRTWEIQCGLVVYILATDRNYDYVNRDNLLIWEWEKCFNCLGTVKRRL